MHQFFQGNKWRSDWKIFKWISELKGLTKRFPKISVATWHIFSKDCLFVLVGEFVADIRVPVI